MGKIQLSARTDPLPWDKVKRLPGNLLDALRCLEKDTVLSPLLGESFVSSYLKLKHQEWHAYNMQITPWELDNTLDC
jgi:glutamine synthetase